jgi:DNA-directed RNA polymerase subunit N
MIIPIRCFSCGFPVSAYYDEFRKRTAKGEDAGEVMNSLGVTRYCCRRMLMGQVDLIEHVSKFKKA